MILIEFKTGKELEVNSKEEVMNILIYCNPTMIRHYQQQMKHTRIIGFGPIIELERIENER